jgi:hypothetical protein
MDLVRVGRHDGIRHPLHLVIETENGTLVYR